MRWNRPAPDGLFRAKSPGCILCSTFPMQANASAWMLFVIFEVSSARAQNLLSTNAPTLAAQSISAPTNGTALPELSLAPAPVSIWEWSWGGIPLRCRVHYRECRGHLRDKHFWQPGATPFGHGQSDLWPHAQWPRG